MNDQTLGIRHELDDIKQWSPTPAQLREAILGGLVTGCNIPGLPLPPGVRDLAPTDADITDIGYGCQEAIKAGRLIDFGHWPNKVIKDAANRGGNLYSAGVIGVPFRDEWLFMHSWEGGVSAYLVNLIEPDKPAGGAVEVVALTPIMSKVGASLMIDDRVMFEPDPAIDYQHPKYNCRSIPSVWRFLPGAEEVNNGKAPAESAAGNVLDPFITALLILSTRNIQRSTIAAADKLQRARIKNRKPPIPPYDVVNSEPYVTAIMTRGMRLPTESRGGSHASPVPHLRLGHLRQLPSGKNTYVRDALVNMTDETKAQFLAGRSHYTVR